MINNLNNFLLELDKFVKVDIPEELQLVQVKISLTALRMLVLRTPVDEGFLRSMWHASEGSRVESATPKSDPINENQPEIVGMQPYSVMYITNAAPYADIVDEGGFMPPNPGPSKDTREGRKGRILVRHGYSIQAPAGMTGPTLTSLKAMFE